MQPLWLWLLHLCMEPSTNFPNILLSKIWAHYSKACGPRPPYVVLLTSSRNRSGSTGLLCKRRKDIRWLRMPLLQPGIFLATCAVLRSRSGNVCSNMLFHHRPPIFQGNIPGQANQCCAKASTKGDNGHLSSVVPNPPPGGALAQTVTGAHTTHHS